MGDNDTEVRFRLSLLEVATLLYHLHRGAQLVDKVGFEDCNQTLEQLTRKLAPTRVFVSHEALESALWSCNLMDEAGEWWSLDGKTFDQFVAHMLERATITEERHEFDKFYNSLKKKRRAPLAQKLLDGIDAPGHTKQRKKG